jgi:uncharacterized protein YjbI with pentapeptide repeats
LTPEGSPRDASRGEPDLDAIEGPLMSKEEKSLVTLTRKEVLEMLADTRDLRDKDIRKANLIKIDFSNCDLRGVNFSYSNLKDCSFRNADMRGTSLWNANLEGADFTNANLEDADLDYAKLRGAILFRANIRRASLPTELIPREDIMASVDTGVRVGSKS